MFLPLAKVQSAGGTFILKSFSPPNLSLFVTEQCEPNEPTKLWSVLWFSDQEKLTFSSILKNNSKSVGDWREERTGKED